MELSSHINNSIIGIKPSLPHQLHPDLQFFQALHVSDQHVVGVQVFLHVLAEEEPFRFRGQVDGAHEAGDLLGAVWELFAAEDGEDQQELQRVLVLEVGLQRLQLLLLAELAPQEPEQEVAVASEGGGGEEAEQRGGPREDLFVERQHELELEEVVDRGLHVHLHKAVEHLAEVLLVELPVQEAQQVLVDADVIAQQPLGEGRARTRAQEG